MSWLAEAAPTCVYMYDIHVKERVFINLTQAVIGQRVEQNKNRQLDWRYCLFGGDISAYLGHRDWPKG